MKKKSETTISEKSYSKGQSSYSLLKVFKSITITLDFKILILITLILKWQTILPLAIRIWTWNKSTLSTLIV